MAKSKNTTKTRDNPAKDLLEIVSECSALRMYNDEYVLVLDKDLLMQKLCSFVVRRDSKVYNHAFKVGQEKLKEQVRKRISDGHPGHHFKQEFKGDWKPDAKKE